MLPKGWQLSTVGEACAIKNNLRLPLNSEQRARMPGSYPYFGPTGILDYIDHYRIDEEFAVIGEDGDHFLKFRDREMTLLFNGKANVNNHAHIIGNSDRCLAKWFCYWFMHRNLAAVLSRQGVGRYKLTKASLESLKLLLPPIPEQSRIVRILAAWDEAIKKAERLIANSRMQKNALMRLLLMPSQRLDTPTERWRLYRLGDLFSERNELGRLGLPLLSITREEGVINREDVGRKDTSNDDKSKYLRICPGDIGYNTMRMWQGVSALSQLEGIVSPAYTIVTPGPYIDSRFAAYLFKFRPMVFAFYRHSQGLVSDTWNLKYQNFAKIKVMVPPRQEQERIVAILSSADALIINLEKKIAALQLEKRVLMSQLLAGKRRVNANAMKALASA